MEWFKVVTFVLFYMFIALLGVNLGYHRFLAHKSFRAHKWFENLIVLLGLPAGTPIQWAGNHRAHHRFEDTENDPHSPKQKGLLFAHTGWYLKSHSKVLALIYSCGGPLRTLFDAFYRPRSNQEHIDLAEDISADPFLSFISRPWPFTLLVLFHLLISATIAHWWIGEAGILVFWALSIYIYNVGDSVNSFGHRFGKKPFQRKGEARDNWLLAIIAFGEGWHAGHHKFPASARHGINGQFDLAYSVICGLQKIGLIHHHKLTSPKKATP